MKRIMEDDSESSREAFSPSILRKDPTPKTTTAGLNSPDFKKLCRKYGLPRRTLYDLRA